MPPEAAFGTLSLITLLLFVGATGKSAQIPLYVWLPDAMEGPTPVSALIHAATMVTAGVYMIGRNAVLFAHAPITLGVVAVVGAATALLAGTIGLVQNDIKRVLAYSTVSQLGYMFLAMGVGAFGAGIFHLYTHAFFKALLFLGSGAVIHALHGEQDMRHMGGLKKDLPITYWTFLIGVARDCRRAAPVGLLPQGRDPVRDLRARPQVLWVIGALTSLLTAIYMFRLVFLTFHGERRMAPAADHDAHGHAPSPAHAHAGFGGHGSWRHRPRAWRRSRPRRAARRAAGDGDRARRARRRLGARRLRRRAACARRPQHARRMVEAVVCRHFDGAGRVQRPGGPAGGAGRHDAGRVRPGRCRSGPGVVGADSGGAGAARLGAGGRITGGSRPAVSTAWPRRKTRPRSNCC